MKNSVSLTGIERTFDEDDIIVSKTDLKGRITYANQTFLKIADYTERQVMGQPHSIIRHPAMPRCVFKLLWQTIASGNEIFAYVINRTKHGDHYWVYAHVTPSFNSDGEIIGYHSNRRVPDKVIVNEFFAPLYKDLRAEELRHDNRKDGMASSERMILDVLTKHGVAYDEFVATIGQQNRRGYR
ncbi:PAS domain-containing protein [Roseibium sp.]|uniref:PAS domain-containing protein n=1 Tax=Roseibium sp. TaxID=1936156 RepID=UPI0039F099A8